MHRIKDLREKRNLTQSELAERAGLSLRTVQRIESGKEPKGYTLRSLAGALEVDESVLQQIPEDAATETGYVELSKLRLLNTLAFTFLVIPYGNVLFPFLYWKKNKHSEMIHREGLKVLNFQIFWTLTTSLLLIICPYLQKSLHLNFSLILWTFSICCSINLLFLIKTSLLLKRKNAVPDMAPIHFL